MADETKLVKAHVEKIFTSLFVSFQVLPADAKFTTPSSGQAVVSKKTFSNKLKDAEAWWNMSTPKRLARTILEIYILEDFLCDS